MLRRVAKALLPPDTARRKAAKIVARKLGIIAPVMVDGRYTDWVYSAEALYWEPQRRLTYKPLISIIVPVFNVPEGFLKETVFSVVNQTYDNWELLLVNASSDRRARDYTTKCAQIDERIRIVDITKNLGIGENTNRGIEASTGEYIALLDHDDTLAPQALYEVACRLQGSDKPGFIYSDEDKLTPNSEYRYDPHFKSDWSPHLLRQVNYLNHFTVIQKKLIDKVGTYRKGFDGAQDYDFYLRLIDEKPIIAHIPKVLYHWRAAPTSTAADFSTKKNILEAGTRAVQDHLERNKIKARVSSMEKQPGYYHVQYESDRTRPVAVVLLVAESAHHYAEYARQLVHLLSGEADVEVFTNNLKANQKYLAAHEAKITNIVSKTTADFLGQVLKRSKARAFIVLNAAVLWEGDAAWIRDLAGYVEQCDDVAAVAPLLVDKFGKTIVDAGYVRQGDTQVALFSGYPAGAHTFFGSTVWTRNVDVLSGRVMVLSRASVERYLLTQDSVQDACGRMQKDGRQLVMCPAITLQYVGDFHRLSAPAPLFSPVFGHTHYEFGFPVTVRFNPSGDDNA